MRHQLLLIGLLLPAALMGQSPRTIPVTVITDFGGAQDDPAAELLRVTGAVRTDDGRFVVANGKPLEVRVYDGRGRLQRRLGRSGNGPGEFQFGAYVRHWPGDSVATYSPATRRWMLFRLDGTLVREWPLPEDEAGPQGVTLIGGAFVLNNLAGPVNCRAPLIRRLAPVTGPLHQVMVDPAGRTWLRASDGDAWRVVDAAGRPVGTVSLPGFTATQMRGDTLIGYRLDEDDFPHIVAQRLALPSAPALGASCPPAVLRSGRSGELKATIRNAMTAAEAYYADHGRYPRDLRELGRMLAMPEGLAGRFEPSQDSNSFAFSAWEVATGYRCLVAVGFPLRSYPEGTIGCGG